MRSHGLASVLAGHPCAEGHSQRQEWIGKRPYAQRSDPDEEDYAPYESPLCVPSLAQHQERDGDLVGRGQQPEQGRSKGGDVLEEPPVEWDYGIVGAQRDELVGATKTSTTLTPMAMTKKKSPALGLSTHRMSTSKLNTAEVISCCIAYSPPFR